MNSRQAKAEPLHEFLGRMGYQPAHVRGNDIWYRSPFRPMERTPSFKIDRTKNVWFDHGLGSGGTIIDFVQQLNQTADISRVLSTISDVLGNAPRPTIVLPDAPERPKEPPIIESVGAIEDAALEAYVRSRAIPLDLARLYLKEVAYRVDGHPYRALAFANDSGGFEVRNAGFQGTIGEKDLSYLPLSGSHQAAVFEGFFDFLSVLAYYGREQAKANVLVLNSLSMLERGKRRAQLEEIQKIYAYLDHDDAGRAGLATLGMANTWDMVDASTLYAGHKDANEFLIERMHRHNG
jgi:hypothetical protein